MIERDSRNEIKYVERDKINSKDRLMKKQTRL